VVKILQGSVVTMLGGLTIVYSLQMSYSVYSVYEQKIG